MSCFRQVVHIFSHIHQTYVVYSVCLKDKPATEERLGENLQWLTRPALLEAAVSTGLKKVCLSTTVGVESTDYFFCWKVIRPLVLTHSCCLFLPYVLAGGLRYCACVARLSRCHLQCSRVGLTLIRYATTLGISYHQADNHHPTCWLRIDTINALKNK